MRIVSRTARSLLEQKREKSMRKRQAAGTLATAFPRVEQIRIQLRFISKKGAVPAAQTHALYPSAQAYLSSPPARRLRRHRPERNRLATAALFRRAAGQDHACPERAHRRYRQPGPPCGRPAISVDYWIAAQYQTIVRATG
jgi:hypothetical protein